MAAATYFEPKKGFFLDEEKLNEELGMTLGSDRDVDWTKLLHQMRAATPSVIESIRRKDLNAHPRREAFQLFGVLTPSECEALIEKTEEIGYQTMKGYSTGYRSNTRRIIFYEELRNIIWDRISTFMKQELSHAQVDGAKWRAYGLNPQFRFCRYEPGQKFAPHYDGNYMISSEDRSFYTFMIYLNGGFNGGATNFLSDAATPSVERGSVLESLAPEAGMLLVFEHNIYHEGEKLDTGVKYMMRTDVMYKLECVDDESKRKMKASDEAKDLLTLAEQYEAQGKADKAAALYRKAFKMSPELEARSNDEN